MSIILYSNGSNGVGGDLQNIIKERVLKEQTEIHHTIESLSVKLGQLMNGVSIAILLITTKNELQELISMKPLFENIRIILILPDRKKNTIALGLKLYPSFFSYADGRLEDVAAVLEKMLERNNQ